ncbi:MAG: type 1 periplasmic binding fold superfamily protein [Pricia sp.]
MKYLKTISLAVFSGLLFTACSDDDNGDLPEVVNEEEIITTMTVTLVPNDDGAEIILKTFDADGDGPGAPEITVSDNLTAGVVYTGSIVLLNESVSPADDITEEVEEEGDEHQFFYTSDSNLDVSTEYGNTDEDGNPLGTEFTLTAGAASAGTLTFTLRHEPKKPNDGTLADAGGETDVDATFDLVVE